MHKNCGVLSQMQVCGEEDGCCTLEDDKYGAINKSHGPPSKVQVGVI
jgi:hypothetical protein